ncbi:VOC family protein [Daejeonella sp. JGW-45]|uniref:VOC family protein n=1 Tax=Daejeonella sp. JGW-45 TaxID=3034148 RepID=UPI0023EC0292|nr:VOC family protein [Daejeonella sp. JGW-45]
MDESKPGQILWHDLTVDNAELVSDFYHGVLGWEKEGLNMSGYDDFVIKSSKEGEVVAGVCHAKGVNKDIPPQWLMYVKVSNLEESIAKCRELGGKTLGNRRKMGEGHYQLIQDPAGAYMMLCE